MRSDWSTVGALSNVTGVYKRRNLDAGGEHCVELKAEVQVMLLQAEKCPRLRVNHHMLAERHGTDSPFQGSERHWPRRPLDFRLSASRSVKWCISVVWVTQAWYFVMAALASSHTTCTPLLFRNEVYVPSLENGLLFWLFRQVAFNRSDALWLLRLDCKKW